MIRFVVISSHKRGAIEPAEVLSGPDQVSALDRWELDGEGVGEIVIWRGGEPRIAPRGYKPEREELKPKISPGLRRQVVGEPCELVDAIKQSKKRREVR